MTLSEVLMGFLGFAISVASGLLFWQGRQVADTLDQFRATMVEMQVTLGQMTTTLQFQQRQISDNTEKLRELEKRQRKD